MNRAALLASAEFQDIRYDERSDPEVQRALVRDACAELGCDPDRDARHWLRNRNADLWTIDRGGDSGGRFLLKILTSKPAATLEREHEHLTALAELGRASGAFRVPEPGKLFRGRSAYLMRFVAFEPLVDRLLAPGECAGLDAVLGACGRALATIHAAWGRGVRPFDAAVAAADFEHLPWTPGREEAAALDRTLARLDGRPFPDAGLYLDFDPVNVGVAADGVPLLLDPPERTAVDAVQWDLGVFAFGLRRAAWRRPLASRRFAAVLPGVRRAFVEGYAEVAGDPLDAHGTDGAALVGLAEIARLGQLWRWWLRPLGFRDRAVGVARAVYAWPLLRAARRQLIEELRWHS